MMAELTGAFWNVVVMGLTLGTLSVVLAIWFERKAAARVQRRVGPLRVSGRLGGLLQPLADLLRIAVQTPVVPRESHAAVFTVLPILSLVVSMAPIFVIPFTSIEAYSPLSNIKYSLLLAVAISLLASLPIVAMGWASGNKFALIGSLRESFILVTYDIIVLASIASVVVAAGSFNIVDVVAFQERYLWLALINPLGFIALVIAMLLASSSFPFEIAESEVDVVAGPYTEFSGILYALSMAGNYVKRYVYSIIASLVYLGGWHPLEPQEGIIAGLVAPSLVVLAKALPIMLFASFTRPVYGRLRLDQALDAAWRLAAPLALASLAWSLVLRLLVGGW